MTNHVRTPDYVREYANGLVIEFFDGQGPARKYLVTSPAHGIERERFTSVTTITGCFEKSALKFASYKLGVEGAITLAQEGFLPSDVEAALAALKKRGLAFYQVWGAKADAGTLAHQDLVALAAGEMVDLDKYPPEVQGFVQGISAWMADYSPTILEAEVPVASPTLRIAGRFDWLVKVDLAFLAGHGIVDLKTTSKLPRDRHRNVKPPYEEHSLQLRLYDIAARECGYPATDWQGILRVDETGAYDFTLSWVDDDAALACVQGYRGISAVNSGAPRPRKAAA